MKGKITKRLLKMFLFVCIYMSLSIPVMAATVKCYTIQNRNTTAYSNTGLTRKLGTIYGSDELYFLGYSNSYAKVRYPVRGGTKTGYIPRSAVLTQTGGTRYKAKYRTTTYKRPNGAVYGYVAVNDTVLVLGTSGSYTQIQYNVSGGYKFAFVRTSDVNRMIGKEQGGADTASVSNGLYTISSALNNNLVMDVSGNSTADGANIMIHTSNGGANQKFYITSLGNGWYKIIAAHSNKAVDVAGGSSASGTNVWQYTFSGNNAAQMWRFLSAGNGYYYIQNRLGNYLDVSGGVAKSGQNLWVYTGNKSNAQKFKLTRTSLPASATTYYVTASPSLVLRKSASSSSARLTAMPKGSSVSVYSISNGWAYLSYGSYKGYASAAYLSRTKPASTGISLNVPVYRQFDSRWGNVKIGTKTIRQIGCTTCCLSMKYSYQTGTSTTPNLMKKKLSYSNNDLIWSSVQRLGYTVSGQYRTKISNSIMKIIYNQLKAGKPVILGGVPTSRSNSQHWVVVTGYKGTGTTSFRSSDFTIIDPNSAARTTLAQFLSYKPYVYRLIY